MCRRSDQEGLDRLIGDIENSGGSASGQLINAIEENVLEELINKVRNEVLKVTGTNLELEIKIIGEKI